MPRILRLEELPLPALNSGVLDPPRCAGGVSPPVFLPGILTTLTAGCCGGSGAETFGGVDATFAGGFTCACCAFNFLKSANLIGSLSVKRSPTTLSCRG